MATLEVRLTALAQAIAGDVKALNANQGSLATLNTTVKSNLVAAINEVLTIANAAGGGDATQTDITNAINSLRTELRAGASAALDTFAEVATQLATDQTAAASLATAVGNRVRFDASQTLDSTQKSQARSNIGAVSTDDVGNTDNNLVTVYNTAKA